MLGLGYDRPEDERPLELQLSLGPCDLLAAHLADTGVAMLVWCEPGELRSGTQLALRRGRERDLEGMSEAISTIGVALTDPDVEF